MGVTARGRPALTNILFTVIVQPNMLFALCATSLSLITSDGARDFYHVLGLQNDCTDREIEVAYQRLSRKWHPDKNKGNAEAADKFTDINDAYATLRDLQKRRIFDLYGESGVHLYESPQNDKSAIFGIAHSDDPNQISARVRKKGATYRILFPVEMTDFLNSSQYDLLVTRTAMCRCPHRGFACTKCRGKPTIRENVTLSLIIEKGIDDRTIVLFKNAGDTSEANAPGDIEVEIVSRPHPIYQRVGSDLHTNMTITFKEALLGFKKTLPHIDGSEVIVDLSNPINADRTIRIPGKGLPLYLYPGEFGDIVVHADIKWPKSLPQEQRDKIARILQRSE
jgi:DnaJ family protein B protein 11